MLNMPNMASITSKVGEVNKGLKGKAGKIFCAFSLALVLGLSITDGAVEAARTGGGFGDLFSENATSTVPNSKMWRDTLKTHTARLWVEAQFLDEIVLNARARVELTWLPKSLLRQLDKDRQVDEWAIQGLNAYYSNDKKLKSRLKGRDVLVLNFKAEKTWGLNPTELQLDYNNGKVYQVSEEDLFWSPKLDELAELPSGTTGTLYILVPSLKAGSKIKITLGPDSVDFNVPKK